MRSITLRPAGMDETIDVTVENLDARDGEPVHVVLPDGTHDVEHVADGPTSGWIRVGGRIERYHFARRDARLLLWVDGRTYEFDLPARTAQRSSSAGAGAASGELNAPMPGTVLAIKAWPGDAFEAHEPLVVMESMKMEMTLSAPAPGRVVEILCEVGDLVDMGAVLARLEPQEHEA